MLSPDCLWTVLVQAKIPHKMSFLWQKENYLENLHFYLENIPWHTSVKGYPLTQKYQKKKESLPVPVLVKSGSVLSSSASNFDNLFIDPYLMRQNKDVFANEFFV